MNVRSASFRDLDRVEEIYRRSYAGEPHAAAAPPLSPGDSPVPHATLLRLWHAVSRTLSSLVPTAEPSATLFVAEDADGEIVGFIQAHGVPGQPKAWHVINLCTVAEGRIHAAGERLLTHLVNQGMQHGVTRFSVRLPLHHPLVGLFLGEGFSQYATEQILYRDDLAASPPVLAGRAAGLLRPARGDDRGGIHLLYLRTTPSHVANVEGPSLKAWQASFQQGWMARIGRDDVRHLVVERLGIEAWVGVRPATPVRPSLMALLCDGSDPGLREDFVDAALAQVPPGPVSCALRHYDSELIRSLQRRGFAIYGTQLLLVRDLAIRMRVPARVRRENKPVLVPAGLVHSAGGMSRGPLRVLTNAPQPRSSPSSLA
jgi:ribosomal protein S18 acetylase RimI-like enzyme